MPIGGLAQAIIGLNGLNPRGPGRCKPCGGADAAQASGIPLGVLGLLAWLLLAHRG